MDSFLNTRLDRLRAAGTFRELPGDIPGIDFWSNDYLGLARVPHPPTAAVVPGATGSRLISGDNHAYHALEARIAAHHGQPAALVFNSGYTANLGLLSALLRRMDTIVYDELSHACCRDGIRLGQARALRFRHNDLVDLRSQLEKARPDGQVFVLTEGRFSMDGDLASLRAITEICEEYGAHLLVDEAHSGGIEGERGAGLVAALGLQERVFATVITYGKAFASHGAAVLGSKELRSYLVNTCRPFIYTTGPAPAQWRGIELAYSTLKRLHAARLTTLRDNVTHFRVATAATGLSARIPDVSGPIQVVAYPSNAAVLAAEAACREAGLLVKAIRSPTVAAGSERLRVCLHAHNTEAEIDRLCATLSKL